MLNLPDCNANRGRLTMAAMKITPDSKDVWRLFGPWLQQQRKEKGRTQKEVAAAADLHHIHYAKIEGGKTGTKKETLDKIINYLALDAQEAYQMANMLPEGAAATSLPDDAAQVIAIFSRLSDDERGRLMAALSALYCDEPVRALADPGHEIANLELVGFYEDSEKRRPR